MCGLASDCSNKNVLRFPIVKILAAVASIGRWCSLRELGKNKPTPVDTNSPTV